MAGSIGEAKVDIEGDLKPLEKDIAIAKALLEGLGSKKIRLEAEIDDSKVARFDKILGSAVGKASQLNKIKFDNFNELAGGALAADSLLNVLGNVFDEAGKVRRIAVQMGAALATAFAAGAQGAGALISGLGRLVSGLEAAAGLGVIAVGIKLQLNDAEVAAAKNNLTSTFKEVGTRASASLKPVLSGFFNDLSANLRKAEPVFKGFFDKVSPAVKNLGDAFNKALLSPQFAELFDRIGNSAAKALNGLATRLPGILDGFLKITAALKNAGARIREAFGPGILDSFSVTGFVNGINAITDALVAAGPGIKAFKANFGLAFDAAAKAIKGVLVTIGQVGPALFNALGPIAAQAATSAGQIASAFIVLSSKVFPAVQASAQQFIKTFGTDFAQSITLLAGPLSAVINGALQLGTALSPLLPIFSQILTNLDPIATGFLHLLTAMAPLGVAIATVAQQLSAGFGPVAGAVLNTIAGIASTISGVLTPVLNALSNSGILPLIGGFAALVAILATIGGSITLASVLFSGAVTKLVAVGTAARAAATAAEAGAAVTSARMVALGGALNALAPAVNAARSAISTAYTAIGVGAITAAEKVQVAFAGIGPKISSSVRNGVINASVAFPQLSAAAQRAGTGIATAFNGAKAALLTTGASARVAAIGVATVGVAGRVAEVGMAAGAVGARLLGGALALVGGPIGLILIGIQLLIVAWQGFTRILKGVIEILQSVNKAFHLDFSGAKESFKKGIDDVVGGAKDAAGEIKDSFTGGVAGGIGQGAEQGAAQAKTALSQIHLDAGAAGSASGQSFAEQFGQQLAQLDPGTQIATLEALFKDGGLLSGNAYVEGFADRQVIAQIAAGLKIPQETIDSFTSTGDAIGSGLTEAMQAKLADLKNIIPNSIGEAESLKKLGEQIGGEGGAALVKSAEEAITRLKGGPQKAAADALKPAGGEAAKQGNEAAQELITSVTEALRGSKDEITASISLAFDDALGILPSILAPKFTSMLNTTFATSIASNVAGLTPQIVAALSLAFDGAFAILPGILGPKISLMLSTSFATSIATGAAALSPQIVAALSLAFDTAFAILPGVLGPKISLMLSTSFATSIATSTAGLSPQIVAALSLAFDGAFAILPGILGPKISLMLDTAFAAVTPNGLLLAATFQTVFTGAINFALINIPAAIGPTLNQALLTGTQLGLAGFGTSIIGSVNDAFITGFSGVGAAIQAPLSAAFLGATSQISSFAATAGTIMTTAANNINNALAPLATSIPEPIGRGMADAVRVTQNQLDTLVNSVSTAKSRIDAIDFYSSGYAIGSRLAAGIRAATAAEVIPAADAMAQAVRDRTPSSPAKAGPLSGQGDPLITGGKIVKRLIEGIQAERPKLEALADKLMAEFKDRGGSINIGTGSGFSRSLGGGSGLVNGTNLTGAFNPSIGGRILQQDTNAQIGTGTNSSVLQIRPGNINILVPDTDDPRKFINDLSRELMTNCVGR